MNNDTFINKLNRIKNEITNPNFLKNAGLGNEVGYYIFDYNPHYELQVREHIKALKKEIKNIVEYDIYDLVIDFLKDNDYLDDTFAMEEDGLETVINELQPTLGLTEDNSTNYIVNYIVEHTKKNTIVFITGIGKVYPIVRSHTILNNLHQKLYKVPVVMFFPGEYTGQKLRLFNTITDDNYYRAFQLCK